jgi:hypothetical protein
MGLIVCTNWDKGKPGEGIEISGRTVPLNFSNDTELSGRFPMPPKKAAIKMLKKEMSETLRSVD